MVWMIRRKGGGDILSEEIKKECVNFHILLKESAF